MESLDWYSKSLHMFSTTGDWNLKHFGSNVTHKVNSNITLPRLWHKLCFQPGWLEYETFWEQCHTERFIHICILQWWGILILHYQVVAHLELCVVVLNIQFSVFGQNAKVHIWRSKKERDSVRTRIETDFVHNFRLLWFDRPSELIKISFAITFIWKPAKYMLGVTSRFGGLHPCNL